MTLSRDVLDLNPSSSAAAVPDACQRVARPGTVQLILMTVPVHHRASAEALPCAARILRSALRV